VRGEAGFLGRNFDAVLGAAGFIAISDQINDASPSAAPKCRVKRRRYNIKPQPRAVDFAAGM
jgi:hypothetical protein